MNPRKFKHWIHLNEEGKNRMKNEQLLNLPIEYCPFCRCKRVVSKDRQFCLTCGTYLDNIKRQVRCQDCQQEMTNPKTSTCTHGLIQINGKIYVRNTIYFDKNERCHDCNIVNKEGNIHHDGCAVERCPKCGGQLLSCNCVKGTVFQKGRNKTK